MLKTVLELAGLAVVFAVGWLALRRAAPERLEDDGYMRNIRASTGNFGTGPLPQGEMDPMRAPIFPPPAV